ncbi:MAG: N-acetylglucosamine-6-phosphate deacetylase [Acidimicrobiales bacterium mtb01]|nr:amidohydrolase family protein [Actinomycetota bacterium]TEX45184.1 MAG: N-acetylglucosamine-6-phosphate deacetylase [Acidimicrobiales bacterium mtb01]
MHVAGRTLVGHSGPGVVSFGDSIESVELGSPASGVDTFEYLVAGFVDLQVNGHDDVDLWEVVRKRDHDALSGLSERLLDHGVTSWLPTLVTAPLERYRGAIEFLASSPRKGAERVGVHLEGPFLGRAPGAHRREDIIAVDHDFVESLPPGVTMMTIAPESPGASWAIATLTARGVRCSLGHSRPTAVEFALGRSAGARAVTHLFNAMSGVDHRDPGLATWALLDDALTLGLIADGVHVHPDVIALAFRSAGDRIALVSDSVGWTAGAAFAGGVEIREGAPRLGDGTLAGTNLTLDRAVRVCVQAGVPAETALLAASCHPAALMGLDDRGSIEPGRRADLVALDADLCVAAVWLEGRRVR